MDALEAASKMRAGIFSPAELLEDCLSRVAQIDSKTKAFLEVFHEDARERAAQLTAELTAGQVRSALHGVPVGLKDLIDVAGAVTTCGSRTRRGHHAARDAHVVELLRDAGLIIIGKCNTDEFAYAASCPPTRNAWDLQRSPGGSSGGSAVALAARLVPLALGTDTGGSIRCPAAFNGIVGLKPTYGRVSRRGVVPLSWSLDHVGPMARSVRDCAALLTIVAGRDSADRATLRAPVPDYRAELGDSIRGLCIGVATNWFHDLIQPDVQAAFDAAVSKLEELGARRVQVRVPDVELTAPALAAITAAEASVFHHEGLWTRADEYTDGTRAALELGEAHLATHYVAAQRARTVVQQGFRAAFENHKLDVLVTPTLTATAPKSDDELNVFPDGSTRSTVELMLVSCSPGNLSGLPAISVPCGFDADGLPVGMMVTGRPLQEATVLRVASSYEAAAGWDRACPHVARLA